MRIRLLGVLLALLTVLTFPALVVACAPADGSGQSQDAPSAAADPEPDPQADPEAASGVDVILREWGILPNVASVAAGDVKFHVANSGPADVHELVVLQSALGLHDLPTADDGTVLLDSAEVTVLKEEDDIHARLRSLPRVRPLSAHLQHR